LRRIKRLKRRKAYKEQQIKKEMIQKYKREIKTYNKNENRKRKQKE